MERELFLKIRRMLRRLGRRRSDRKHRYTDGTILEVYYWAVLHDRPTYWACRKSHWPPGLRRGPLPSQSAMSRRLRSRSTQRLKQRVEKAAHQPSGGPPLVAVMDGKALPIALHSTDRQSGKGRGVGNVARGYKLHAVVSGCGKLLAWRLAPLNVDERVMAERLVRDIPPVCYLVTDAHYDSNTLFAAAAERGIQQVTPRRHGPGRGLGHRRQHPARLRSMDILENPRSALGPELMRVRRGIERFFASLSNFAGGLTGLPPWVRTYRRVRDWVQAKIVVMLCRLSLHALRRAGHA